MHPTRVLSRRDLLDVLDPQRCLDTLRDGFVRTPAADGSAQRVHADLPFPGTASALIPGLIPGVGAYTVKVNAKFPAARPALRGVICLHSADDGGLLALLDSATITAWRTGLAAALGTHTLAPENPARPPIVGIIGAGAQAELMIVGLRRLQHRQTLVVYDIDTTRADAFAARHGGRRADSISATAAQADIILIATWSRTPILHLEDTRPGQHITSLGADEPGKRELSSDLLNTALLTVDDRELAARAGLPAETAKRAGTLGEILAGRRPGRTSPDQRTIYAPVGLPWRDLAISWLAYQQARRLHRGTDIDLLN